MFSTCGSRHDFVVQLVAVAYNCELSEHLIDICLLFWFMVHSCLPVNFTVCEATKQYDLFWKCCQFGHLKYVGNLYTCLCALQVVGAVKPSCNIFMCALHCGTTLSLKSTFENQVILLANSDDFEDLGIFFNMKFGTRDLYLNVVNNLTQIKKNNIQIL